VVFGLKRFRQYILGRKVLVRSDHAALSYLHHTQDPVAQQARWLDFIEQFDVAVQHRSGSAHRAADALLRRPCERAGPCNQCDKKAGAVVAESALQYESWGDAVVGEPRCSGVVTRGGARAQDHAEGCHGDEVLDPTRISRRSGDPSLEAALCHQDPPLFKSTPATSPLKEMGWSKVELQALHK